MIKTINHSGKNYKFNTAPEVRSVTVDGVEADYNETLEMLYDEDALPCGITNGPILVNDRDESLSYIAGSLSEVADIIGDTTWHEICLYSSINELNRDVDGVSFGDVNTDEPEFEMGEV